MHKFATSIAAVILLAACGQATKSEKEAADNIGTISEAPLPNDTNVVTTTSGLQFQVLTSGPETGPHPTLGQIVCVHYRGAFTNDEEFDSSYSRNLPTAFPSNGVIKGWVEALSMMRAGDKWKLTIPPELGYGKTGTPGGPIGPNETLVFEVELLKLLDISLEEYMATYRRDPTLDCSKHAS